MLYDGPGELVPVFDGPNYGPLWADRYPLAIVLHTTETAGVPGYGGGSSAPHLTVDTARRRVFQHQPLNRRAGSLRGSNQVFKDTGVRVVMNEKAVQVEIIGYSDRAVVQRYGRGRRWVGDFTDEEYAFLAEVVHYLKGLFGIGDALHARPAGDSWKAGISSPYRLSAHEWEQLDGMTAHGGVFGQTHWDTGVLDLHRIWTPNQGDDMIPQLTTGLREEDIIRHHELGIVGPQKGQSTQDSIATWVGRLANPNDPAWNRYWAVLLAYPAEAAARGAAPTGSGGEYRITLEGKARPA